MSSSTADLGSAQCPAHCSALENIFTPGTAQEPPGRLTALSCQKGGRGGCVCAGAPAIIAQKQIRAEWTRKADLSKLSATLFLLLFQKLISSSAAQPGSCSKQTNHFLKEERWFPKVWCSECQTPFPIYEQIFQTKRFK